MISRLLIILSFLTLSPLALGQESAADKLPLSTNKDNRFEIINKGIGGNNSSDLLKRVEKDVLVEKPDLVIIMVGTNDMLNSKKLTSYPQYEINYQMIIDRLKANNIETVLMSPPPVDTAYVLKRHDPKLFEEGLTAKIDSAGRIAKKLADQNDLYFIDLNSPFTKAKSPNRKKSSLILNQANSGKEDGIHPTEKGYSLIGDEVYRYLKKNKLLNRNKKIICFGDSITYGSFMEGAGTSEGATYPAVLKRLINQQK